MPQIRPNLWSLVLALTVALAAYLQNFNIPLVTLSLHQYQGEKCLFPLLLTIVCFRLGLECSMRVQV